MLKAFRADIIATPGSRNKLAEGTAFRLSWPDEEKMAALRASGSKLTFVLQIFRA